ncbi:MAG: NAD-specific glutamate dehydrogenase protein, partial [Phenylobacterium sp.]|nr:NAD-specific glutamate dehydrogenase protein [Phenylobacterium sp.]
WSLPNAARLYDRVGRSFAFDRLRAASAGFTAGDAFERTAVRRLVEDLLAEQASLTRQIIAFAGDEKAGASDEAAEAAIGAWSALRRDTAEAARKAIEEIEAAGGPWTFAKLTIANAALRELTNAEAGKG